MEPEQVLNRYKFGYIWKNDNAEYVFEEKEVVPVKGVLTLVIPTEHADRIVDELWIETISGDGT